MAESKLQNDLAPLMTAVAGSHKYKSPPKSNINQRMLIIIVCMAFLVGIYLLIAYYVNIFPFVKSSSDTIHKPGLYGKWAVYSGSIKMQQKAPNQNDIAITRQNVDRLQIDCTYLAQNGTVFMGYPTVDNDNNAYFTDFWSGYITAINLDDNCTLNWRQHIGELLGHNTSVRVVNDQSLTIYQDSNGNKGLLFGTPTRKWYDDLVTVGDYGCYAVSIHLNNGSLWWKLKIGDGAIDPNDYLCTISGFVVDENYAYGGIKAGAYGYYLGTDGHILGGYVKIDIDKHKIVHKWRSLTNINKTEFDGYNRSYRGMSSYGMSGAIIDDYLIFGTSNLHDVPKYIEDCFEYETEYSSSNYSNPFLALNQSVTHDICGNNVSNIAQWRCLEKGVYVDSLMVLNKTNFETIHAFPLQGLDVWPALQSANGNTINTLAMNADVVPVAAYKGVDGMLYAAGMNKAGRFHIFNIQTGELVITKKFGPQGTNMQFGWAVDEDAMIGIATINGFGVAGVTSRYTLLNDVTVCNMTGSIHAFDLLTGATIWQMIHPYGSIDDSSCFNKSAQYNYDTVSATTCEKGAFLEINEHLNVRNVGILHVPLKNDTIIPIFAALKSTLRSPFTIVKDMVFVPSDTGDIWVLDIHNGSFIHHLTCPNQFNQELGALSRPGIKGGISVFDNRIVFYCGSDNLPFANGNIIVSMKL